MPMSNPYDIRFTPHASLKFEQIRKQGIQIDESAVINAVLESYNTLFAEDQAASAP